jgi:hypothetical protein
MYMYVIVTDMKGNIRIYRLHKSRGIIECSVGDYGYNCNQSCDGCLSNSCDKKQGACTNTTGCKPGWQYVQSGLQKCDIG